MKTLKRNMAKGMDINDKLYRKRVKQLERFAKGRLPRMALNEFKDNTPRDKGNARRNTKLKKGIGEFTITGDYDYSGVLDKGLFPDPPQAGTGKTRGGYSTQAPKGMIEPTTDFIDKEVKKFIRRIT